MPVLLNALSSEPGSAFHTMALRQLERCATRKDGIDFLLANLPLVDRLLQTFCNEEEIGGYEIVNHTLVLASKHFPDQMMELLFSNQYAALFDSQLSEASETIRVRVLDLFSHLSSLSETWFETLERRGYVSKIFLELDNEDLLARLSAFQMLGKICSSVRGLEVMKQQNVPVKLRGMLDLEASGLNGIVLSNAITLIGEIASFNSTAFTYLVGEHPGMLTALHAHIEHDSDEVVQSVIFALARIACTEAGLTLLLQPSNAIIVRDWLEYGHSSNAEMKATTFYSLTLILERHASNATTHDSVHTLYAKLGFTDYPSIEVLNKNLTGGLAELKYAALTLLRATLRYDWGLEEFIRFPGLSDWMLNRGSENTKKGHELKYEALHQALQHPQAKTLLGVNNFHLFLEFVKLGVYYQRAESAVKVREEHG